MMTAEHKSSNKVRLSSDTIQRCLANYGVPQPNHPPPLSPGGPLPALTCLSPGLAPCTQKGSYMYMVIITCVQYFCGTECRPSNVGVSGKGPREGGEGGVVQLRV